MWYLLIKFRHKSDNRRRDNQYFSLWLFIRFAYTYLVLRIIALKRNDDEGKIFDKNAQTYWNDCDDHSLGKF